MTKTVDKLMALADKWANNYAEFKVPNMALWHNLHDKIEQALAEAREEGSKQQMMTGLLSLFGLPVVGEQPDPVKPVAWIDEFGNTFPLAAWAKSEVREKWKPLYTYPPKEQAQPELTNAEIEEIVSSMNSRLTGFQGWGWLDVARAVLKAQKEKT